MHSGATAIIDADGNCLTYRELHSATEAFADDLTKTGMTPGDRVIVVAGKGGSFVSRYLAIHQAGGIAVPLDPETPVRRMRMVADICRPRLIVSDEGIREGAEDTGTGDTKEDRNGGFVSDRPADLLFTSGTTGDPKGVLLTHGNLVASARNINAFIGTTTDDVEIIALPLSHSFGLGRLRCLLWLGACAVLVDGFSRPKQLFRAMSDHSATGMGMVPAAWALLYKLSGRHIGGYADRLRYVEIGSAPMPLEDKEQLAALLPRTRICMHYGLTEASRAIFQEFHEDAGKLDALGRPAPLADVCVKDQRGVDISTGEVGEICVRGPMVMRRYWAQPQRTAESFWGEWFRTGDLGRFDEDGLIYLHGRMSEIINVGGRKVSPEEVERSLRDMPGIVDAACVAVPDVISGEAVKLFVVPETGSSPELGEIRQFLKEHLEPYKLPTVLEPVASIPRTTSGKIQRQHLLRKVESETE